MSQRDHSNLYTRHHLDNRYPRPWDDFGEGSSRGWGHGRYHEDEPIAGPSYALEAPEARPREENHAHLPHGYYQGGGGSDDWSLRGGPTQEYSQRGSAGFHALSHHPSHGSPTQSDSDSRTRAYDGDYSRHDELHYEDHLMEEDESEYRNPAWRQSPSPRHRHQALPCQSTPQTCDPRTPRAFTSNFQYRSSLEDAHSDYIQFPPHPHPLPHYKAGPSTRERYANYHDGGYWRYSYQRSPVNLYSNATSRLSPYDRHRSVDFDMDQDDDEKPTFSEASTARRRSIQEEDWSGAMRYFKQYTHMDPKEYQSKADRNRTRMAVKDTGGHHFDRVDRNLESTMDSEGELVSRLYGGDGYQGQEDYRDEQWSVNFSPAEGRGFRRWSLTPPAMRHVASNSMGNDKTPRPEVFLTELTARLVCSPLCRPVELGDNANS